MVGAERTRYARSGDSEIAYQVIGDGPIDLLLYSGWLIPIECMDDEPALLRFQRRLASFARVIRFDLRGVGLSDRASPSHPPNREQWLEDAVAVLDAVGSERAAVLAPYANVADGILLAASAPERITNLVLINGTARTMWDVDYPAGIQEAAMAAGKVVLDPDAVDLGFDVLQLQAPTASDDSSFRRWWDRAGNLGASPMMASLIWDMIFASDVRSELSLVRADTMIIQRADNLMYGAAHGRFLAANIDHATYVELSGSDLLFWIGDTGPMLNEIEEFVTGARGATLPDRVLATVLITDIVSSTKRAHELGDGGWSNTLDEHDRIVRAQIVRFGGDEVKSTGDGFIATFSSPGRAIECATASRDRLRDIGIDIRAGIHAGEIVLRGDEDVAGMAVHIAARVSALAASGEVLVSSTVKDLVIGSQTIFVARGSHHLKGVPGTWSVFAVEDLPMHPVQRTERPPR